MRVGLARGVKAPGNREQERSRLRQLRRGIGKAARRERRVGACECEEGRPGLRGRRRARAREQGERAHRITTTLAREMARRDLKFGLLSVCAQGGMGFAMVLER